MIGHLKYVELIIKFMALLLAIILFVYLSVAIHFLSALEFLVLLQLHTGVDKYFHVSSIKLYAWITVIFPMGYLDIFV